MPYNYKFSDDFETEIESSVTSLFRSIESALSQCGGKAVPVTISTTDLRIMRMEVKEVVWHREEPDSLIDTRGIRHGTSLFEHLTQATISGNRMDFD